MRANSELRCQVRMSARLPVSDGQESENRLTGTKSPGMVNSIRPHALDEAQLIGDPGCVRQEVTDRCTRFSTPTKRFHIVQHQLA